MVACMEKACKQRLAQERLQQLHARLATFKPTMVALAEHPEAKRLAMHYGDIVSLPEVRELMDVPLGSDAVLGPSSFDELRERFGEVVERWHVCVCDKLRAYSFGPSGLGVDENIEPLELATSRFRCKYCYSQPSM